MNRSQSATHSRRPSSPKRASGRPGGRGSWYDYYAGYSDEFARDALSLLALDADQLLLDPWNGSGTTTQIAFDSGISARGFDLNPAMVMVARSRLVRGVAPSYGPLGRQIVDGVRPFQNELESDDPLSAWFGGSAAQAIRGIERSLQSLLFAKSGYQRLACTTDWSAVSGLAAFYYVALFRTVRSFLRGFRTSNPTWIRVAHSGRDRVRPSLSAVIDAFLANVNEMAVSRDVSAIDSAVRSDERVMVSAADSRALPLLANSVDAVLSSPPYCTRIDYAVATRPELALLGMLPSEFRALRGALMGTSTIDEVDDDVDPSWGASCKWLLSRMERHSSKAASSYYRRNLVQYFGALSASLREMDRVLKPGGKALLVVQDSYFKDLRIDLARIVEQMADATDWRPLARYHFDSTRHMGRVNPGSKRYRPTSSATESVLLLQKAG